MKQPVQADMYPNMWVAIAATYKNGGLGGFYTGMAATLMRDVPWNALSFLFVNILKTSYEGFLRKAPSAGDMMAIGATGGALAAIIMTPVDVVKTRLMTQKPDAQGVLPYAGILQCLLKVSGEEGPGALMKGVTPRCLYLGPLSAVVHTIYEKFGTARARPSSQPSPQALGAAGCRRHSFLPSRCVSQASKCSSQRVLTGATLRPRREWATLRSQKPGPQHTLPIWRVGCTQVLMYDFAQVRPLHARPRPRFA